MSQSSELRTRDPIFLLVFDGFQIDGSAIGASDAAGLIIASAGCQGGRMEVRFLAEGGGDVVGGEVKE